ncbi:MAG: MgtC/SapB family protein [Lachnospirales bacterium]
MEVYSIFYLQEIFVKILFVIICGGLIGMEREHRGRPAGLRTHIVVCMGSMAIMLLSIKLHEYYYVNYNQLIDPNRLSAQVVSGIGFLGAGTIMKYGTNIKGLTTAATVWTVAIIGICIGAGFYLLSFTVSISLWFVLMAFSIFERLMLRKNKKYKLKVRHLDRDFVTTSITYIFKKNKVRTIEYYTKKINDDVILDNLSDEIVKNEIAESYIVVNSPDIDAIHKSIDEINQQTNIFDIELID